MAANPAPGTSPIEINKLHLILPELVKALNEKFENVKCDTEHSADFFPSPYRLSFTKVGSQLCLVSKNDYPNVQDAIKEHFKGNGATLGVHDGFHVLCSSPQTPSLGLKIQLKNKTPSTSLETRKNWRSTLIQALQRLYATNNNPWEFFCVELLDGEKAELLLLSHSLPVKNTNNNNSSTLTVWLFPFVKIVPPSQQNTTIPTPLTNATNTPLTNGTNIPLTNGTNTPVTNGTVTTEQPKPKKKVVRRVVKKTNPDGTTTKTVVGTTDKKLVKKKVPDANSPKENSPDVVQEIIEDQSSVSYVIRMGQSPVNELNSSSTDQQPTKEPIMQNGTLNGVEKHVNGVEKPKDEVKKVENGMKNGVENGIVENGVEKHKANGIVENGVEKHEVNGVVKNGVEKHEANSVVENGVPNEKPPLINGSIDQNKSTNLSNLAAIKTPDLPIVDQTKPSSSTATTHSTSTLPPAVLPSSSLSEKPPQINGLIESNNSTSNDSISKDSTSNDSASKDSSSNDSTLTNPTNLKVESNEDKMSTSSSDTITIKNLPTLDETSTLSAKLPATSSLLSRRTASPLTVNDSTIAPSTFNSAPFLTDRRLSAGNPMSPTESDFSLMDDISFSSTMTAPSSVIPTIGIEKRDISPIAEYTADVKMRGMTDVPVVALQLVLSMFSYKELSEFRRVSPHWDELCGQMLNSGYYELIHKADLLMNDCQRRVNAEKHLQRPLQVLTNLQVHVLNPVDILRAAMDEGVLCFPYGEILDRAFELLDKIEKVMGMSEDDGDCVVLNWERLSKLSRVAQTHYRRFVEPEVEKRMTEVYKLSAQQRLQRLDSFLVETTVNKLEKVNEKTRDDLKWEVEQLKSQNTQLKKDNRDLKQLCAKLESRIETIERKLKTLGRLLN